MASEVIPYDRRDRLNTFEDELKVETVWAIIALVYKANVHMVYYATVTQFSIFLKREIQTFLLNTLLPSFFFSI